MSYILDALRRADRDRQQQDLRAPSLRIDGMSTPSLPIRRARLVLPVVVIAAAIVTAAWWISQRAPDGVPETSVTGSAAPSVPATRPLPAAPPATGAGTADTHREPAPMSPAVAPTAVAPATGVTAPAAGPSPTAEVPAPIPTPARPHTSVVVDAVAVPPARTEPKAPPAPGVAAVAAQEPPARPVAPVSPPAGLPPAWRDLPAEERRALPHPDLDVHVYDDAPQRRFVLISLRKYREGEALPDGLLIDEITPEGIVVEHRGHRYTLPRR